VLLAGTLPIIEYSTHIPTMLEIIEPGEFE